MPSAGVVAESASASVGAVAESASVSVGAVAESASASVGVGVGAEGLLAGPTAVGMSMQKWWGEGGKRKKGSCLLRIGEYNARDVRESLACHLYKRSQDLNSVTPITLTDLARLCPRPAPLLPGGVLESRCQ